MSQTPPTDEPMAENASDSKASRFDSDQRARIEALLDQWEITYEAGNPIPVETLCGNDPELTPEIRDRIAALQAVDQQLAKRKRKRDVKKSMPALEMGSLIDDLEFLSAGGLGEVFVGEDGDLHRRVAVKFMHAHLAGEAERRGQFALEAEITGRLEHPGVVPLYGFGSTADERPFYAMRYIEGRTMDEAIKSYFKRLDSDESDQHDSDVASKTGRGGPLDTDTSNPELEFRRLLSSFVSVCKTIAYAHNRGVVHRDLKPANIMIGRFGETIVVDWGLAVPVMRDERFRSSGEETLAISPGGSQSGSASGRGAGTPAFMSPEQFSDLAPSPANDIYSLGATLFVLLCGKPPIRTRSLTEIRTDTLEGRLPDLNELRRGVPKQLQAIAYKAMQKEAKDRYPTALDLARDVERYLADEPVSAYTDSIGLRVARMARRHRLAAQTSVLGLMACLLIAGLSAALMGGLANRADRFRDANLATSAQFIARACGYEVDRVWQVLEFEANAPELRDLVKQANAALDTGEPLTIETQPELHDWLLDRLSERENVPTVESLFVLSMNGTQLSRVPIPSEPQVGENFGFRDYYTGLGYDLPRESRLAGLIDQPLVGPKVYPSGVHMSAAYESTLVDERHLKVTFTVPIYDDDGRGNRKIIGLIGTSIRAGDVMAETQIGSSHTWIADLREDMVEGRRKRGLLLHYPRSIDHDQTARAERLSGDLVEKLQSEAAASSIRDQGLQGLSNHNSVQKVVISGRDKKPFPLGWVVITAEPEE